MQPDYLNGSEKVIDAEIAEIVAEPKHIGQIGAGPEKRASKAVAIRNKVPKRDNTFMPAMSMDVALARRAAIVEFTRRIMVRDQDFGEIPGTHKPALLKPGAEKLCSFFGLEPEFRPVAEEIDWTGARYDGETFCYVRYQCRLFRQRRILGVGEGSCNSRESRYRYRWVTAEHVREDFDAADMVKRGGIRTCSEFEFAVDRAETAGAYGKPAEYWIKFKEAISAGTARRVERDSRHGKLPAWEMDVDTTLYRVPNPDIADLVNTIQKMAQKRALVAATLIATSASEFFTQDVEDLAGDVQAFAEADERRSSTTRLAAESETTVLRIPEQRSVDSGNTGPVSKPWKRFGEMRQYFEHMRERVGETRYFEELNTAGVRNPGEFRSATKALECYSRLVRIAAEPEVA